MSFRVSVVYEDHTNDQYIGKPVIQKLLASLGRPNAMVHTVTNPRLKGIDQVRIQMCGLLKKYGQISDVVLFAIDADGQDGSDGSTSRKDAFMAIARECPEYSERAVVVCGVQELEVWALWGNRSKLGATWEEVRGEQHPKETYFEAALGAEDTRQPGGGRRRLVSASLQAGWASLATGCPELADLAGELAAFL